MHFSEVQKIFIFKKLHFLGRTGPLRLKYSAKEGERIYYYDFKSLYPSRNFETEYPIGHPVRTFWNLDVDFFKPEHFDLFFLSETLGESLPQCKGLFKVFVVPPQHTTIPVLPAKFDDR